MSQQLDNLNILRGLSILVVVAFHAYGMLYVHFSEETNQMYACLYEFFNQSVLICIAMPMFVFVSGYLFSFLLSIGKYPTWKNLLKKKVQRIWLPYIFFCFIFTFTTGKTDPITPILQGNYWHLWFLPMLFWCFIIYYAIYKSGVLSNSRVFLLICILLFGGVSAPIFVPMFLGLQSVSRWLFWFFLGGLIYQYKTMFIAGLEKNRLWLWLVIVYFCYLFFFVRAYGEDTWYSTLGNASMLVAFWYLSLRIEWSKYAFSKLIYAVSGSSLGLYIFHNWVEMHLLSNTSKRLFHLESIAATHEILFPILFCMISLFISWMLTNLFLKTRLGKFLIG